jgi:hypothetical protein
MALNLDQIHIAKPCSANWDEMSGDERARHCGMCKLNVYNLSSMTRDEAEKLILEKEGKLCVRLFKRADGTVITQDCPVGLAKLRKRLAILSGALAASIFLAAGSVLARFGFTQESKQTPAQSVQNWLKPPVAPTPPPPFTGPISIMGSVCPVAPPITPLPVTPPASTNTQGNPQ